MYEDNNSDFEFEPKTGTNPGENAGSTAEPVFGDTASGPRSEEAVQPEIVFEPEINHYAAAASPDTEPPYRAEPETPKQPRHLGLKIASIAVVCALLGSVGGGVLVGKMVTDKLTASSPSGSSVSAAPASTTNAAGETVTTYGNSDGYTAPIVTTTNDSGQAMDPSEIYANYAAAVVAINVESITTNTTNVFGQDTPTASSGSGFIISTDGYIVTNYHVIADAISVNVLLADESSYDATVVGYDDDNDVALLKIDATDLPTVSIGDSDSLKVGELVVAIGNPLGELTRTLTVGYVSALDREIDTDGKPINVLQTDAAINAGNSGGPLFDSEGNVIGITNAKYASSSIEGLGFAIPINDAINIVYSIQQYGYVKDKPSLGISVGTMSLSYASYYGMPVGCYVNAVNEGSGAETGGMQAGDIITKIGDADVRSVAELTGEIKNYKAGDTVSITVYRNGEYKTLSVTFDEKLPDYMTNDSDTQSGDTQDGQQSQGSQSGQEGQSGQSGSSTFNPFEFFFGNGGSGTTGGSADSGTAA